MITSSKKVRSNMSVFVTKFWESGARVFSIKGLTQSLAPRFYQDSRLANFHCSSSEGTLQSRTVARFGFRFPTVSLASVHCAVELLPDSLR
jgi:hypothetical protein